MYVMFFLFIKMNFTMNQIKENIYDFKYNNKDLIELSRVNYIKNIIQKLEKEISDDYDKLLLYIFHKEILKDDHDSSHSFINNHTDKIQYKFQKIEEAKSFLDSSVKENKDLTKIFKYLSL